MVLQSYTPQKPVPKARSFCVNCVLKSHLCSRACLSCSHPLRLGLGSSHLRVLLGRGLDKLSCLKWHTSGLLTLQDENQELAGKPGTGVSRDWETGAPRHGSEIY